MPAATPQPPPPDVILLNGTSSAGKTTLTRALQRRAGRPLLHASLDTFTDMFLWEAITDAEERRACHAAGVDHFHRALALFATSPFDLVVDHLLLTPAWHEATYTALAGRRVHFIGVHCPPEILLKREAARPDRRPGLALGQLERVHAGKSYDFEVDTSLASPEACADQVLAFIGERDAAP
ncbi:MAG: AAA family ATPase [Opitutaceae bacterium]|nr:AAA family ATPase [Opitutaceae bacterium]